MVTATRCHRDVVLVYPGLSLLLDVADWLRGHTGFHMRVVQSRREATIRTALDNAAAVIVDATDAPDVAAGALGVCLEAVPAQWVTVYTERIRPGLELLVRSRGAALMLGPLSRLEWEAFLRPVRLLSPAV